MAPYLLHNDLLKVAKVFPTREKPTSHLFSPTPTAKNYYSKHQQRFKNPTIDLDVQIKPSDSSSSKKALSPLPPKPVYNKQRDRYGRLNSPTDNTKLYRLSAKAKQLVTRNKGST